MAESRLSIVIDSRSAEQRAQDVRKALQALEDAGVRVTATVGGVSKEMGEQAKQARVLTNRLQSTRDSMRRMQQMQAQLKSGQKGLFKPVDVDRYTESVGKATKQTERLSSRYSSAGLTAKQLQQAQRQLPMQFTDIFTSLASGQPAMQVFLQQGGQLKDVFGGAGPALRGMAGYIASLINPATVAAGSVAALVYAYESGADEQREFEKTLTLTGNSAGITAGQLGELASQMDDLADTTQNRAASALNEVVKSGKFTADQFELVTEAALVMQGATGQAVSDTIEQFTKLADDPVDAVVELNEQHHFLTSAIYDQIAALNESGQTVEAQRLAMETYADTMRERSSQVSENIGWIEQAWKGVKAAFTEVWDGATDIGRTAGLDEQIAAIDEQIKLLESLDLSGGFGRYAQSDLENLRQAREEMVGYREEQAKSAEQQAKQNAKVDEHIALQERRRKIAESIVTTDERINSLLADRKVLEGALADTDDSEQRQRLQAKIDKLDEEAQAIRESTAAYQEQEKARREATRESEKAERARQQAIEETERAYASLLDTLYPLKKSQREYADQKAMLIRYAQEEGRSNAWLEESLNRLDDSYRNAGDAAEVYGFTGQKAMADIEESVDPMVTAVERGIERLDDSFADAWRGLLDGSEDAFSSFKNIALDTLSEIIHAYTTRQITASLGATISGGAVAGQSGGMGGMGDLASIGNNVYNGVVDGFGAINWTGAPTSYSGGFAGSATAGMGTTSAGGSYFGGSMSNFGGMSGLAALPASMAGNYVGGELGTSLTGKQANSNIGSTIGTVAGTYFGGPIGAFIGSTLGSMIDSAFGSSPPELDLALQRGDSALYDDRGNWDEGVRSRSAFGTVGLNEDGTHDMNSLWDPAEAQKLFDGIAQLDNALGALAETPEQLTAMQDAVLASNRHGIEGHYGETSSAGNIVDILGSRYKDAIDVLDLATEDFLLAFEGKAQDLVQVASNLGSFEAMVGDNATAMAEMQAAIADTDDIVATTQELVAQAQAMGVLSNAAQQLSLTFDATASGALAASGDLAELVGGIGNLTALNQQYFDAFYTEQEKFERLSSTLSDQFADIGATLPETRDGVRSLVEGLDLMTESGREQYAAVMQLVPSLDQYINGLEKQEGAAAQLAAEERELAEARAEQQAAIADERWGLQNELLEAQGRDTELLNRQREKELAALDESNRALQQRIWSLQDETEAAQQAAIASKEAAQRASMLRDADLYASGLVGNVSDVLESFSGAGDQLDDIAQTRQAQLSDEYRAITSLSDLIDSLAVSDLATSSTLDAARRQYDELYQRAAGGDAEAAQELSGAAQKYLELARDNAGTAQEYARVYGEVTNGVSSLEAQFGESVDQLDDVERTTDQQLREQEKINYTLLDSLQEMVDQTSSLDSIADLIDMLPDSLASQLSDLFPEYGSDVGQSAFNEAAYLANKTAQVNANNQGGRSDWTTGEVLDRIMQDFGSVYEHYQQYGRDEGVLPGFGDSSDAGSAGSAKQFNEDKYLSNYLDYLNGRDERSWSELQMLMAFNEANLTPYEHWMRYGRSEGVKAYATGAWKLDSDQLAYVHKDEMVVPSRNGIADEFRAYASGNSYGELLKEVKQLRSDLAASQRAIAENTRKSARVLERYDLRQRQEEFA